MSPRPLTEGERWAREELGRLRTAGLRPAAIARFLARSRERAGQARAARPQTAGRARAWTAAGALAWVTLAAAGAQPFRRRRHAGLAWWAATALMLDWHVGMFESESGEARNLGPADALTLLRAWLVPVAYDAPGPGVIALAAATDALDGVLARATVPTRAGRDLEGLVDACFGVASLRGAVASGHLSPAVAAVELTRLGAGVAYATTVYLAAATAPAATVLRAARLSTPVRAGGLLAASTGHRRLADALVTGGSLWSLAALARAVTPPGSRAVRA